jgi:hypothetical protein
VKPNGEQFEADANFLVAHFNIHAKDDVPAGSRILGDPAMATTFV